MTFELIGIFKVTKEKPNFDYILGYQGTLSKDNQGFKSLKLNPLGISKFNRMTEKAFLEFESKYGLILVCYTLRELRELIEIDQ